MRVSSLIRTFSVEASRLLHFLMELYREVIVCLLVEILKSDHLNTSYCYDHSAKTPSRRQVVLLHINNIETEGVLICHSNESLPRLYAVSFEAY